MKILIFTYGQTKVWALIVLLAIFIAGCKDDGSTTSSVEDPIEDPTGEPAEGETVMKLIQSNPNLTTLAGLLEGTAVEQTLSTQENVTIFAPSDDAFALLDQGYLQGLTSEQLLHILTYHLYDGAYQITNEIKKEMITSLSGDRIYVEIGQPFGNLLNTQAELIDTNIEAVNGLIHIIDGVLIPDSYGTLGDNLQKRYNHRLFYSRLEDAGLSAFLESDGTKTMLAASDSALNIFEEQWGTALSDDQWKEILDYHLLDLSIYNVDFDVDINSKDFELTTLYGEPIYVTVVDPHVYSRYFINGSEVNRNRDWGFSTNGDLVSVDGVLLPDKYVDVLTLMGKRFNLKGAHEAFAGSDLKGTLYDTNAQFTVFVPSDDVPELNDWQGTGAELAEILKYHVINTKLLAADLMSGESYTTWQGETITIQRSGDSVTINGTATITLADLEARNGVVHVINGTLAPPVN